MRAPVGAIFLLNSLLGLLHELHQRDLVGVLFSLGDGLCLLYHCRRKGHTLTSLVHVSTDVPSGELQQFPGSWVPPPWGSGSSAWHLEQVFLRTMTSCEGGHTKKSGERGETSGHIPHQTRVPTHTWKASCRECRSNGPLDSSAVSNLLKLIGKVTSPLQPSAFNHQNEGKLLNKLCTVSLKCSGVL